MSNNEYKFPLNMRIVFPILMLFTAYRYWQSRDPDTQWLIWICFGIGVHSIFLLKKKSEENYKQYIAKPQTIAVLITLVITLVGCCYSIYMGHNWR